MRKKENESDESKMNIQEEKIDNIQSERNKNDNADTECSENLNHESDQEEATETDNRSLGEKCEDALDNFFGEIQDFLYGPGDNFNEDIPATMEMDSGIRKINKVQTRRNI